MNKKIVIFGGGTGISDLACGLNNYPVDITMIIAVSDNGSSTGKLREEFLMPAMGDIRKVIVNLSNVDDKIKELLEYRFDTYTDLDGHPVGNLIMVALYNITGSLKECIRVMSDFLGVKHKILPLSEDYLTLMAETVDGKIICGESEIGHDRRKFKRLFYDEEPTVDKEIIDEIISADLILFSIGSLFTSIIPHLLSRDVVNAIDSSKAKVLYTCNALGQEFETLDYTVGDHVCMINNYLGKRKIDTVIAAKCRSLDKNKDLVKVDRDKLYKINCELIEDDLLIINHNYIGQSGSKLARSVFNYLMR